MTKRLLAVALLGAAACSHNGTGPAVRADITARMESTRPAIGDCYATELKTNRKLAGTIDLSFMVTPKTGAFSKVAVTRDDMHDTQLEQCVTTTVGALKLATPQKANVSVPSYPIDFAPNK